MLPTSSRTVLRMITLFRFDSVRYRDYTPLHAGLVAVPLILVTLRRCSRHSLISPHTTVCIFLPTVDLRSLTHFTLLRLPPHTLHLPRSRLRLHATTTLRTTPRCPTHLCCLTLYTYATFSRPHTAVTSPVGWVTPFAATTGSLPSLVYGSAHFLRGLTTTAARLYTHTLPPHHDDITIQRYIVALFLICYRIYVTFVVR